jgi:uncharacterized OsmC-like protein
MADDAGAHQITVRLDRDYRFTATFEDVVGQPTMIFDEPSPIGSGTAPSAASVLGAAVGNCLAASLAFCLRRARVDVKDLEVHVTTHVARNERGRLRITSIDVELDPTLGEAGSRLARCEELFEDFCIVTASVREGIPVTVSVGTTECATTSTLAE